MPSPSRLPILLVVIACVMTACGSTVQNPQAGQVLFEDSQAGAQMGEDTLVLDTTESPLPGSTPGATPGASLPGASTAPGATVPGSAASGQTGAGRPGGSVTAPGAPAGSTPGQPGTAPGQPGTAPGAPSGGQAPAGGGQPAGPVAMGQGVTADEITLGISLFKAGDVGAAIGVGGVDFGNTEAQAQAVVDHLNASGGIAGRQIRPVYYVLDFGRAGTVEDGQSEQEACARWTEDNEVFAVVNTVMARQNLLVCLAERDVPGVHDGMPIDARTLATYHDYYYTGLGGPGLTLDRQAFVQTEVFGQAGWLDRGVPAGGQAVVGIEHFDDPAYKRVVDEVFVPQLRSLGVEKIVLQAAPRGGADGAVAYASRFQREGVTHVLFLGEAAAYPLFFMRAAENQLYRPQYGLNTDQQLAVTLQAGAPAGQLANAIAVGWLPVSDVDNANDPGPVSTEHTRCLDIQRTAGQDMSNRGAQLTALGYCSGLFFLQQTIESAPSITPAGLAQAVAGLGTSFVSPATFGTSYSAERHDGVSFYRDMAFQNGAFFYTSGTKPMP